MARTSPTQRSLKMLRDDGWTCQIVEHWNPFSKRRVDLFGVIDILCIKDGETLGVQTTTMDNRSKRIQKIAESEEAALWMRAGNLLHVHGWRKLKKSGRWECSVWVIE